MALAQGFAPQGFAVEGRIVDALTGRPLARASVSLRPAGEDAQARPDELRGPSSGLASGLGSGSGNRPASTQQPPSETTGSDGTFPLLLHPRRSVPALRHPTRLPARRAGAAWQLLRRRGRRSQYSWHRPHPLRSPASGHHQRHGARQLGRPRAGRNRQPLRRKPGWHRRDPPAPDRLAHPRQRRVRVRHPPARHLLSRRRSAPLVC